MDTQKKFSIERAEGNPVIHPGLCTSLGENINGPSVIEVPDWVQGRLGRYYLYFGHHNGKFIRLAYADQIEGPWQIYQPGVLPLSESLFVGHLASPDVHVDHTSQKIRMYYHGSDTETGGGTPQLTRVALSNDGLAFSAAEETLATSYMRVFRWQDWHYGLVMPGKLYRSRDGLSNFELGPSVFPTGVRHSAVRVEDSTLQIFYTRIGDCPESVLYSELNLSDDWNNWKTTPPQKVLEPEFDYEGVGAPHIPSVAGIAVDPAYQLRDPALFKTGDRLYLLYSVAGEQGIALAHVLDNHASH